jgi:hypothetical protein
MGLLIKDRIEAFLQLGDIGMGDDSLLGTLKIDYTSPNY